MANCSYSFPLQGNPQEAFIAARTQILKQGGAMAGSSAQGTARIPSPVGAVSLDYRVLGSTLEIDVTDKPWVVGCDKIKAELQKALAYTPVPQVTQQATAPAAYRAQAVMAAESSGNRVIELDTQYIEGDPVLTWSQERSPYAGVSWKLAAVLGGLLLFSGGLWWLHTRRR